MLSVDEVTSLGEDESSPYLLAPKTEDSGVRCNCPELTAQLSSFLTV